MRLPAIQTSSQQFCLLQLDRAASLAEALQLDWQDPAQRAAATQVAEIITTVLSPEVSGIVVSPEYTFSSIINKSHDTGLLLSLEQQQGAVDPLALPALIEQWGVEHVSNNYALAKLELFYHPQEPEAIRKKQLVAEISHYCQLLNIDFLLELRLYPPQEEHNTLEKLQEAQMMALEDVRDNCDLLALEYPTDTLTAVTITAELDIPWVVTGRTFHQPGEADAQINYAAYKEKLRTALESGAAGFLVDTILWQEDFANLPAFDQGSSVAWMETIEQRIKTGVRDKIVELTRIANESAVTKDD